MKNGLKDIVGKQIAAVLVTEGTRDPRQQLFLVFDDGTSFEIYGENFTCCAGLDPAAGVIANIESHGAMIIRAAGAVTKSGNTFSLHDLLIRDIEARREVKEAIAKAKKRRHPREGGGPTRGES